MERSIPVHAEINPPKTHRVLITKGFAMRGVFGLRKVFGLGAMSCMAHSRSTHRKSLATLLLRATMDQLPINWRSSLMITIKELRGSYAVMI